MYMKSGAEWLRVIHQGAANQVIVKSTTKSKVVAFFVKTDGLEEDHTPLQVRTDG